MSVDRPYKVLIVEDNEASASTLQTAFNQADDFTVIGITDSAEKAFHLIKTGLPDAIVVDLQLKEGDGIELMTRIHDPEENLPMKPYILATTQVESEKTITKLNSGLADFVYQKSMRGYSAGNIVKHFRIMSDQFECNRRPSEIPCESILDKEAIIRARVEREIDKYYTNHAYVGRDFLIDAICMVLAMPKGESPMMTKKIFPEIARKYKRDWHAVDQGIQRLIHTAFSRTDEKDLEKLFAPYIDIGRGAPTNKEFIIYIANKIRLEKII